MRPAPHRKLSAGAVLYREGNDGLRFLLLRAFRHWDFPKGMVEPGEASLDAAIREIQEETGINRLEFPFGEEYRDTPPYSRGKVARYYIACTPECEVQLLRNPQTGIAEHAEFRWVSFEEAWDLTTPRVRLILRWAGAKLNIHTESDSRFSSGQR